MDSGAVKIKRAVLREVGSPENSQITLSSRTESELCDLGQVSDLAKPAFPFCTVDRGSSYAVVARPEKLMCAQLSAVARDERLLMSRALSGCSCKQSAPEI